MLLQILCEVWNGIAATALLPFPAPLAEGKLLGWHAASPSFKCIYCSITFHTLHMRSGEQFNIPARIERRVKHAEAGEGCGSPAELQRSVTPSGGCSGTGHPGFVVTKRPSPRPAGCPRPGCPRQSSGTACSGFWALPSVRVPWPQVLAHGAPGLAAPQRLRLEGTGSSCARWDGGRQESLRVLLMVLVAS